MRRSDCLTFVMLGAAFIFGALFSCGGGGGGGGGTTTCDDLSATASPQIQAVRDAGAGSGYSLTVHGAFVTYVKDAVGGDPAGFFLQAGSAGPAIFAAVDPAGLSPVPQVGDQVSLTVTAVDVVSSLVQVTDLTDYSRLCQEPSASGLAQDLSAATDVVSALDSYDSELIDLDGLVVGSFSAAGTSFVAAVIETAGITGESNLTLRLPETLQDSLEIEDGCQFILDDTPLWRFATVAQPSAWVDADIQVTSCPDPQVISAVATTSTAVLVTFDRDIAVSSVLGDGSQFTFTGGLTASSASVSDRQVAVITSAQTPSASYTVTVAGTVTDNLGSGVDPAADQAAFKGYDPVTPGEVIINEVYYDSPSSDVEVFVELKGTAGRDLSSLTLVGVNGNGGVDYNVIELSGIIPADGYFVVADTSTNTNADLVNPAADYQNGPADNVVLVYDYGGASATTIDALGYGTFTTEVFVGELSPTSDVAAGNSLSRCPDGLDTDDNSSDFLETTTVTPGAANSCP